MNGRSTGRVGVSRPGLAVQSDIPQVLLRLLQTADGSLNDSAWRSFVAEYSRLLLYVTRRTTADYDASMDAYAFVLEKLRENDLRRLRGYASDGRGKFTTWLVVVCRRLCLDYHRQRYGRAAHSDTAVGNDERVARRRLVDLAMAAVDDPRITPASGDDTEGEIQRDELERALAVAMTDLPSPDRLLLTLRFRDGLSGAEIASLLHFASPFHVYRRLNQLLATLRHRMVRLGVHSSVP